MKQAMIFAAGLGTRLRPLTDSRPKALVEVGGKALLEIVINRLKEAGFSRIVINVHHFADQIIDFLAENDNFGVEIAISDESKQLLETGGGIRHAQQYFSDQSPILIHNVDILSNADIETLYEKTTADASLLVSERQSSRYLLFDDDMNLVGWTNVQTGEVRSPIPLDNIDRYHRYAFSGIHAFSYSLFEVMEGYPERFKIIDFYIEQCRKYNIKGFCQPSLRLLDVGKVDSLAKAEEFLSTL